jgi:multidrug transporter EmrE-like cation transporter
MGLGYLFLFLKIYLTAGAALYIAGFLLLTQTLKHLPMGWTNAIWAGASTIVIVVLGLLFFNETVSVKQGAFLLLIVIGLVGLEMVKEA